jgi:putative ABC transport system permease protein
MGRLLLIWRLVIRDIRRRPVQSLLLVAMIATATTTLTLGLALHRVSKDPFARTRSATRGPDLVAEVGFAAGSRNPSPRQFAPLLHAAGVRATAGPYPVASVRLTAPRIDVAVQAEGRDAAPAQLDRPLVSAGSWVRAGGVVLEQGLADTLGLRVGDTIRLAGHPFAVVGIALTTAQPFYPARVPGLVWLTRADAEQLATRTRPLAYVLDIKLSDPASAVAFGNSPAAIAFANHSIAANVPFLLQPWQESRTQDYRLLGLDQKVLLIESSLLAILAIAGIAVLVGGRMAQQTRRVGLLKAVGATPALVAIVLLAENLLLALAAALIGLTAGELLAPPLASPGQGLLGGSGSPHPSAGGIVLVIALAAAVAAVATIAPAIRGARTSTVRALNDPLHPPRRHPWLIAISATLPASLLLALRLVARRTGRTVLTAAGLTVAVATVVAALTVHHDLQVIEQRTIPVGLFTSSEIGNRANHVLVVLSVILVALAAITAIFTAWATVIDAQRSTALARSLGATPRQIAAALTTAQLLPALAAACIGIPAGLLLYQLAGGHLSEASPPLLWLLAVIPATLIAVAAVTAVPARIGARRPVAEVLRAE